MRRQHTEKHTFFVPPSNFADKAVIFPEEEARHATRVLRLQPDNVVQVIDGEGGRFRVRIDDAKRARVLATILEETNAAEELPVKVTLGIGMLKHSGRFEFILEKATELGVSRIVPLICERTEKPHLKRARSMGILVSAMKQSGRAVLPELRDAVQLKEVVQGKDVATLGLMCHEAADASDSMLGGLRRAPAAPEILLLIGPEGGFSDSEVELARGAGLHVVSLGATRLRSETAAIAAMSAVVLERMTHSRGV